MRDEEIWILSPAMNTKGLPWRAAVRISKIRLMKYFYTKNKQTNNSNYMHWHPKMPLAQAEGTSPCTKGWSASFWTFRSQCISSSLISQWSQGASNSQMQFCKQYRGWGECRTLREAGSCVPLGEHLLVDLTITHETALYWLDHCSIKVRILYSDWQ